jgi:hypothetical protein
LVLKEAKLILKEEKLVLKEEKLVLKSREINFDKNCRLFKNYSFLCTLQINKIKTIWNRFL